MRTYQHIVDTKSIKKVLCSLPDHWVIRELSERDYGVDLLIEIFNFFGEDANGNPSYESSGCICNIQVKGTATPLKISDSDNTIHFSFSKKSLQYIERFATPFFLFRVDVSSYDSNIYFLWMQRYIKDVLDVEKPYWRQDTQESFTIKIPVENSLLTNINKIENIAYRIKYIEEFIGFREVFKDIRDSLMNISSGGTLSDFSTCNYLKLQVKKILRFNILLKKNPCCISHTSVFELLEFIDEIEADSFDDNNAIDFPNKENFELLFSSIDFISSLENAEAENQGFSVY